MPYLPRYLIIGDDSFFHVTWQCHNKKWLMRWDWAKKLYYDLLLKYKDRYGVTIYAYNFMDNHPHITGHLRSKEQFSAFFRQVNGLFARHVNKRLRRKGQLVMDRFKSPQIQTDKHMLRVMAYIDLNQCRAGKVTHPKNNKWSSYGYYANGAEDPLVSPSPSYLGLADNPCQRQKTYREMVNAILQNRETLNVSQTYYIGNPEWVNDRYRSLKLSQHIKSSSRRKDIDDS